MLLGRNGLALLLMLSMVLVGSIARSDDQRLVLAGELDDVVVTATRVAFAPWGVVVVSVPDKALGHELTASARRASALAAEQTAAAVVWLEPPGRDESAWSLWLYDARTQKLDQRPLGIAPPFDEASAAAVALSIKTALRGTSLAPVGSSSSASTAETSTPPPPVTTAPPVAVAAGPAVHALRIEGSVGARAPTGGDGPIEPRVGVGMSVWQRRRGLRFGLGADAMLGPGVNRTQPELKKLSYSQTTFSVSGRCAIDVTPRVAIELGAGPSLFLTSLDGELATGAAAPARVLRLNPAIAAAVGAGVSITSRVELGVILGGDVMLRSQSYSYSGQVVLREPPFLVGTSLRVSVAIDGP